MLTIRKDLFRCGEGRMVFRIRDCENASDISDFIESRGGLAIRSEADFSYDGDGGPFTISLVTSGKLNECSSREAFGSEFILTCCLKNTILPLKNYWLKKSGRFNANFDPQDVLLQKISWFDAESLYSEGPCNEHSKHSDSALEPLMDQPIVKLERLRQAGISTPPLFSEDELSQNTFSGSIIINGLVPVVRLQRVDESEVTKQCLQLWKSSKEDCSKATTSSGLKRKLTTENQPLIILTSSEDDREVESKRSGPKHKRQKRNSIISSSSSETSLSKSKESKNLSDSNGNKELRSSKGKGVKRRVHKLSLEKPLVSSSSSDADEPILVRSKQKFLVNENRKTKEIQNISQKISDLHSQANESVKTLSVSVENVALRKNVKTIVWPENFSSEMVQFVEVSSSVPGSDKTDNENSDEMVQKTPRVQENETGQPRLVGEVVQVGGTILSESDNTENLSLRLETISPEPGELNVPNPIEIKDFSVQCDFEEPICEDVAVQTDRVKIVPAESHQNQEAGNPRKICATVNKKLSAPKNSSDFVCQTDFIDPVLCDKVCQTKAVIVRQIPLKDCIVSLDAHNSNETSEENSTKTNSIMSGALLSSENCALRSDDGHLVATAEKDSDLSSIVHFDGIKIPSTAQDCESRTTSFATSLDTSDEIEDCVGKNQPQNQDIVVYSTGSVCGVSPDNNNTQQPSSSKGTKKRSPKKLDVSLERSTRSSVKKEIRSCRSSSKKRDFH